MVSPASAGVLIQDSCGYKVVRGGREDSVASACVVSPALAISALSQHRIHQPEGGGG